MKKSRLQRHTRINPGTKGLMRTGFKSKPQDLNGTPRGSGPFRSRGSVGDASPDGPTTQPNGPTKKRRADATGEAAGRRKARARSGGMCEVRIAAVCMDRAMSAHHRKNRSQGGTWSPVNLLDTCGDGTRGCHGYITEHPAHAQEHGWTVPSYANPAEVPVLRRGVWVLLNDEGGFAAVEGSAA